MPLDPALALAAATACNSMQTALTQLCCRAVCRASWAALSRAFGLVARRGCVRGWSAIPCPRRCARPAPALFACNRRGVQLRGMEQDLSWDNAAAQYEAVLLGAKYQW